MKAATNKTETKTILNTTITHLYFLTKQMNRYYFITAEDK